MKVALRYWRAGLLAFALLPLGLVAQTDGSARLQATLVDYNGSSTKHWTVVWVTTQGGSFIKTLRRQGPTLTSSHWNSHCSAWYGAKAGSTAFDGYSSATAQNYSGTNSPVLLTWNCRDAGGNLVADGNYKFWIQYAEDSGQGPYTSNGLLWTKGATPATNSFANQGANFSNMKVIWSPVLPPEPPVVASVVRDGSRLIWSGTGPANQPLHTLFSADISAAIGQWTSVATNSVDATGHFQITNNISALVTHGFYQLKVP